MRRSRRRRVTGSSESGPADGALTFGRIVVPGIKRRTGPRAALWVDLRGWPCRPPDSFQRNSVSKETDRSCSRLCQSSSTGTDHPGKPPYSHSIINGSCKPLIRLAVASNRAGFTVRCTATSSRIPSRSFHHRSTSIENSRRVHGGQLSRSIAVYRFAAHDRAGRRCPSGTWVGIEKTEASNGTTCCRNELFWQFIYRHYTPFAGNAGLAGQRRCCWRGEAALAACAPGDVASDIRRDRETCSSVKISGASCEGRTALTP
jgi:hypothetical protein